jgi:hypothetical protein
MKIVTIAKAVRILTVAAQKNSIGVAEFGKIQWERIYNPLLSKKFKKPIDKY